MTKQPSSRELLEQFQELTIGSATGGQSDYEQWEALRGAALSIPELHGRLPEWLVRIRWGSQFWQFIKGKYSTYAERREYIWESFRPVFEHLEHGSVRPIADALAPVIERGDVQEVTEAWVRIQSRRGNDPEGAITAARTLVESACKWILDRRAIAYSEKDDLPALYAKVAAALKLGPESHKEQVFKQILGGCNSVVNGLASLRNSFGDAHAKGNKSPKPAPRHAELAVNMAGTLASFLLATDQEQREVPKRSRSA